MASVNFSEKEYQAVAGGAMTAWRRGDREDAALLNELASKMNKALSSLKYTHFPLRSGPSKWRAPGPLDKELGIPENGPV